MIVACPHCSDPFELRDGDIAELVQLECPHCRFRMILDFGAANDQRLVEPGMRMASGYRSAAEYRRASSASPAVARVETPAAATTRPAAASAVSTPAADQRPATHAPARAAEVRAPAEAARTPVAVPAAASVQAPARTGGTVVGPAPTRPSEVELPPTEPARKRADVPTPVSAPEPVRTASPVRTAEAARAEPLPKVEPRAPIRPAEPRADARIPPHTPPGPKPATARVDSGPMAAGIGANAPAVVDIDDSSELDRPRTSAFGMVMLVLLVLLATALTIASVVQKGTPDPRPLLEDIYRNIRG